jgi:hypothetical protein
MTVLLIVGLLVAGAVLADFLIIQPMHRKS